MCNELIITHTATALPLCAFAPSFQLKIIRTKTAGFLLSLRLLPPSRLLLLLWHPRHSLLRLCRISRSHKTRVECKSMAVYAVAITNHTTTSNAAQNTPANEQTNVSTITVNGVSFDFRSVPVSFRFIF